LNEKVALVENHQNHYIVTTLIAINDDGEELGHTHSIIYHEDDTQVVFDLEELLKSLWDGDKKTLAKEINNFYP